VDIYDPSDFAVYTAVKDKIKAAVEGQFKVSSELVYV
jgi:hypothetical protein